MRALFKIFGLFFCVSVVAVIFCLVGPTLGRNSHDRKEQRRYLYQGLELLGRIRREVDSGGAIPGNLQDIIEMPAHAMELETQEVEERFFISFSNIRKAVAEKQRYPIIFEKPGSYEKLQGGYVCWLDPSSSGGGEVNWVGDSESNELFRTAQESESAEGEPNSVR